MNAIPLTLSRSLAAAIYTRSHVVRCWECPSYMHVNYICGKTKFRYTRYVYTTKLELLWQQTCVHLCVHHMQIWDTHSVGQCYQSLSVHTFVTKLLHTAVQLRLYLLRCNRCSYKPSTDLLVTQSWNKLGKVWLWCHRSTYYTAIHVHHKGVFAELDPNCVSLL